MIPGWPYSVIAALEPGRTSWTAVLDAVRLGPDDDETEVTAAQVRDVVTRLVAAGHWREGDPAILVVFDAGYDVTRLAWLLADLPVELLGRLRSDRVLQLPAPPRQPGTTGRPRKHGGELALADPATWPDPQVTTSTATTRYGTAVAAAWDRVHPRLTHRAAWLDHDGAAAGHRGHPDPAAGRSPARRPRPQAGVAVVLGAPAHRPLTWTGAGRRSCAASTWSTPSGCSSRSSAGPPRRSATRPPRTGGPG